MNRLFALCAIVVAMAVEAAAQPLADHHQHLFSPTLAPLISQSPITAADLVRQLDAAPLRIFSRHLRATSRTNVRPSWPTTTGPPLKWRSSRSG